MLKTKNGKPFVYQNYYQNALYVAVENEDLLKNKQKDY